MGKFQAFNHVEVVAVKSMASPQQTSLCCSNGILSVTRHR